MTGFIDISKCLHAELATILKRLELVWDMSHKQIDSI